jgi:hypothetical protein
MSKTADEILLKITIAIAKKDKVYVEGDTYDVMMEKLRVKRQQRRKNLHSDNPIGESKRMKAKRQEKERIVVGSWVSWTSQSQGSEKKKEGEVLAYVPRNTKVPLGNVDTTVSSRLKFDPEQTSMRDRYLVKVLEKTTIRYYTPIATVVVLRETPVEPLQWEEKERIPLGSQVTWEFKPGDSTPIEGKILAYVPAHTNIPMEGLDISVSSRLKFNPNSKSAFDRYLVAVNTKRTTCYYTPSASSVSAIK